MKREYGVLLIGCGHIGRAHLQDLYWREGVLVVGVVDADISKAQEFARRFGGEAGCNYLPFLERPEVDVVIVATYADSHLSILRDCLAAGKHVLCEKPVGVSLEEGEAFMREAKASSCKVQVAHILRHNRTYQTAAKLIQEGRIGNLRLMRMVQNHHAMDWTRYVRLLRDCSPIVDCGVHYLDVMRWFSESDFAEVSGWGGRLDGDLPAGVYNFGTIQACMKNGALGRYEAGWSRNLASENRKEFIGTTGRLTITLQQDRLQHREEGDMIEMYHSETGEYQIINLHAKYKDMWAQLQALVYSIESGEDTTPTLEDAMAAFRAALCANQDIQDKLQGVTVY